MCADPWLIGVHQDRKLAKWDTLQVANSKCTKESLATLSTSSLKIQTKTASLLAILGSVRRRANNRASLQIDEWGPMVGAYSVEHQILLDGAEELFLPNLRKEKA
jgi:hypothetical protein